MVVNANLLLLLRMNNPGIVLASLTPNIVIILSSRSDLLLILACKAEGLIHDSEAICIVLIMLGL